MTMKPTRAAAPGRLSITALGLAVVGWLLVTLWSTALAAAPPSVRVGVLEFGTVRWTLDVVEHHGFARERGLEMTVVPLGSRNAVSVALQGGAVDVIVSDWIWVSRQRAQGRGYTFVPYSVATGAVLVRPDSGIQRLEDLEGQKFGVAGGPVDKSWLLLRAYGQRALGKDFTSYVRPTYGAPPLLNELMLRGEIPAVLNYWHYSARLEAAGMQPLITVQEIVRELGIEDPIPVLGWVFHEDWGKDNPEALQAFLAAVGEAAALLQRSDAEWQRIRDIVKPEDDAALTALREGYRAGIAAQEASHVESARRVFRILAEEGGAELVGPTGELSPGTFWSETQ